MTPYDVMLSESQERMLVIAKRDHEEEVRRLFERWELHCATIGAVTNDRMATVREGDEVVARLPVALLTDPPTYVREGVKPRWLADLQSYDLSRLPDIPEARDGRGAGVDGDQKVAATDEVSPAGGALLRLLASPEVASTRWAWRQYDHQVLTNTVVGPGSDAAVMRIKGTRRAIALSTDGDGRMCYLDPHAGGAMVLAEAARNVVCAGAEPLALTDCLNFGNPEKPEVYYQLEQCIQGMVDACRALGVPVVSGNVSLYNETSGEAVYPTPVIGMLGLIEDVERVVPMGFQREGDEVFLLGARLRGDARDLAGSEYLKLEHGLVAGQPRIDLELEARLQRLCLDVARRGLIVSAHDCSRGGLAVALSECCIAGEVGLDARNAPVDGRLDAALFGEAPSRVVVSTGDGAALAALARERDVPCVALGRAGGERLVLGSYLDLPIEALRREYEEGLPRALGEAGSGF
jgi:phosphoribosylformylglycinamidine synthase